MLKKIIIDCDNTFGINACDIDDGFAIIYALAQKNIEVIGINTTFGNNKLDIVHPNTVKFMKDIGFSNIPVYRGSVDSYKDNEAAKFLVEMAEKYNGKLSIVATGSLTNLYHAFKLDNNFYEKVKDISIMGGVTEPLIIDGKVLDELNFSCSSQAALNVLENGKSLTIATGNTCLDGFFTRERFDKLRQGNDFEKWLYDESKYWFDMLEELFDIKGTIIWDILPLATLLNPDLFIEKEVEISPDMESMKTGSLIGKGKTRKVIVPKIKDEDEYIEHVYEQYKIFGDKH